MTTNKLSKDSELFSSLYRVLHHGSLGRKAKENHTCNNPPDPLSRRRGPGKGNRTPRHPLRTYFVHFFLSYSLRTLHSLQRKILSTQNHSNNSLPHRTHPKRQTWFIQTPETPCEHRPKPRLPNSHLKCTSIALSPSSTHFSIAP